MFKWSRSKRFSLVKFLQKRIADLRTWGICSPGRRVGVGSVYDVTVGERVGDGYGELVRNSLRLYPKAAPGRFGRFIQNV